MNRFYLQYVRTKDTKAPEQLMFGLAGSLRAKRVCVCLCVCVVFIWMTAGLLPMACPEGHKCALPSPSLSRLWVLWTLYTPCPVRLPPVLSTLPATLTQLTVFIQPHPLLHKPNKAILVCSLSLTARPLLHHYKRKICTKTQIMYLLLTVCCFSIQKKRCAPVREKPFLCHSA